MSDLTGAGKFAELGIVLVNKFSSAIGYFTEPKRIQKLALANAEAARIKSLADCNSKIEHANADAVAKEIEVRSNAEIEAFRKNFTSIDNELAEIAIRRMVCEEVKKQINLENILAQTIPLLKESSNPTAVDDDWIMKFSSEARNISAPEIQEMWAKLLAEESNNPNSVSKKTISVLANITKAEALLFERICNYCVEILKEPLLFESLIKDELGWNHYGILLGLSEIGLFNVTMDSFTKIYDNFRVNIVYHNEAIHCKLREDKRISYGRFAFTKAGEDIYKITSKHKIPNLINRLQKESFFY